MRENGRINEFTIVVETQLEDMMKRNILHEKGLFLSLEKRPSKQQGLQQHDDEYMEKFLSLFVRRLVFFCFSSLPAWYVIYLESK